MVGVGRWWEEVGGGGDRRWVVVVLVGSGSGRRVVVVVGISVVVRAMRWAWDVSEGEGTSDRENGRRDKTGVTRGTTKIDGGSAYAVGDVGVGVVGVGLGDYLRVEE